MPMASTFSSSGRQPGGTAAASNARDGLPFGPGGGALAQPAAPRQALAEVLAVLCRFVEEISPDCRCGICLIDWRVRRFQTVAAPSLGPGFDCVILQSPVHADSSPCGRAACLDAEVIVEDLGSAPLWRSTAFGAAALAHGLRSCWSVPIRAGSGQVLGTVAVLQAAPGQPSRRHRELVALASQIAGVAVERAQSEAALSRNAAWLADAQRLSTTGCFTWRVETDDITWSAQLYRIFGFDESLPVTLSRVLSRVHPDDLPAVQATILRAGNDGSPIELEHRIMMPDGTIKHLRVLAHGTRDQDGRLAYVGAVQDVTQNRLTGEALGKAQSELTRMARAVALGALTASIAHEVNQPLSGILINASTCLRMLTADPPDLDGARETMRRTLRDTNRASAVVERLHALFTKRETEAGPLDLNESAREVIALTLSKLQRNGIVLRAELEETLPLVNGDRIQLQQIILNLLLNAAEAMSTLAEGSRLLLIRTERADKDRIRLSVTDSGIGLAAATVERLFEPFYTTKLNGMGIGLYVCRSIAESHRGCLQAVPNDGPGATFFLTLPCLSSESRETTLPTSRFADRPAGSDTPCQAAPRP